MLYEPNNNTPKEKCPCCDYITLPERNNYVICPICYWEDDGTNLEDLDEESGANHGITLRQARKNFKEFGACERSMVKNVLPQKEYSKYKFSPTDDIL